MKSSAYQFAAVGDTSVLEWVERDLGVPGPDEVAIEQQAVGVNYIDIYHRNGTYPLPLPSGIGVEGAGVVTAVGGNVDFLKPGDRVAYAGGPPGAYADTRCLPAARVVKVPDGIDLTIAAAMLFKGLTAWYLTHQTWPVKAGETVLLHAAAGGVGLIAAQWITSAGATLIGVVSSEEKRERLAAVGVEHIIVNGDGGFAGAVREIAPQGVDVVYDSVGKTTFAGSLDSLRQRGMLVSYGTASGPIPQNDGGIFGAKGSLYFTRCTIAHYMARRDQLETGAAALFAAILDGTLRPGEMQSYPLHNAALAQRALESRKTSGSLILIP